MTEKKPKLYVEIEHSIKLWEEESKEVAVNDIARLSETILPDESSVNMYQMVKEGLFVITLEMDNEYTVIYACSEYMTTFSQLLQTLDEIMFGSEENNEEIDEETNEADKEEEVGDVIEENEEDSEEGKE